MKKARNRKRLGILGRSGRMGSAIEDLCRTAADFSHWEICDANLQCEIVIDFSHPSATQNLCKTWLESRSKRLPFLVVGTTGLSSADYKLLKRLTHKTSVFYSPNFSEGLYLMSKAMEYVAPLFLSLGFSVSQYERHHIHKKDKPSGTALRLNEVLKSSGYSKVPTQSVREGEVVGDHEITFRGEFESVKICHYASDRKLFARGALRVANWLVNRNKLKKPKLLGMKDYFE